MEGSLLRWDKAPPSQWLCWKRQHSLARGLGRGLGGPGEEFLKELHHGLLALGWAKVRLKDVYQTYLIL